MSDYEIVIECNECEWCYRGTDHVAAFDQQLRHSMDTDHVTEKSVLRDGPNQA